MRKHSLLFLACQLSFFSIAGVATGDQFDAVAQAEIEVDESLSAETDTTEKQAVDLVGIIRERILGPIRNGSAVEITLRKPKLFENSFLGDKEQQEHALRGKDEWQLLRFNADLNLGSCIGLRICRGKLVVVSARCDLKEEYLSAARQILDDVGKRLAVKPGGKYRRPQTLRLGFVINSIPKPQYSPLPRWRQPELWQLEVHPDSHPAPERIHLEILDRQGQLIKSHSPERHQIGGDGVYGPIVFSSLQDNLAVPEKTTTGAIIGGNFLDGIVPIYSGLEFFWIINLGDEPIENIGKIRVWIG